MGLIGGVPLLGLLRNFRVATIGGRYGGGKTALSFYLAHLLVEKYKFRYIVSNCRSVWTDNPEKIVARPNSAGVPMYLDTVVVLDEAGLYLRYSKDTEDYLSFLRKGNVVLLCPSVTDVARSMRPLVIQRLMNLQAYGLPIWVYEYGLSKGFQRERAKFFWTKPTQIFGIYDSEAAPNSDAGISQWLIDWKEKIVNIEEVSSEGDNITYGSREQRKRQKGKEPTIIGSSEGGAGNGGVSVQDTNLEEFGRVAGDFLDASQEFGDAISVFEQSSRKRRH